MFESLPCVPAAIRDDPRYVGDHVIRHYQGRHLAELQRDLGQMEDQTAKVEIVGGIGVLTMAWGGNTFKPAIPDAQPIEPRPPLNIDQIEARRATCRNCDYLEAGADRCRMCGCGGQISQRTASPWATCPRSLWP